MNELVKDNIKLVYYWLFKYNLLGNQDAESLAMEGLWRAAKTYDETIAKFSTIATVCIRNALNAYIKTDEYAELRENRVIPENTIGSDSPEKAIVDSERMQAIRDAISVASQQFTGNAKHCIDLWVASEFTRTATDVGKEVGVSQSYASQAIRLFRRIFKEELHEYDVRSSE